jgi:hypothetical protein
MMAMCAAVPPKLIHPSLHQKRSASLKDGCCSGRNRSPGGIPGTSRGSRRSAEKVAEIFARGHSRDQFAVYQIVNRPSNVTAADFASRKKSVFGGPSVANLQQPIADLAGQYRFQAWIQKRILRRRHTHIITSYGQKLWRATRGKSLR